jgi:uroporphyrinogen decarboxylase
MQPLTSHERISRILQRKPVDRIGLHESFWPETQPKWVREGHLRADESPLDHFHSDIRDSWCFNTVADLDFGEVVVEETDETRLVRDGNGALLRRHKLHSSTPEHVDFLVKDRAGWEEHARPKLVDDSVLRRRINFDAYRTMRDKCVREQLWFAWSGVPVFELMHPVCGHEYMLMGMALDPDWVRDMCEVFTDLNIAMWETLFAEEGLPDGIWFFEDMGFKERPFMSPTMYKEIIQPSHARLFDYAHARGLPVIVHSCGFVEPLVEGLIEAGMDCLQAMEVKAGMDLVRLKQRFGDRIAFMGGMDVRPLVANDRAAIEAELQKKLPAAMAGGGYCLHTDHSIPDQVEYETYKFFVERGLELGTY